MLLSIINWIRAARSSGRAQTIAEQTAISVDMAREEQSFREDSAALRRERALIEKAEKASRNAPQGLVIEGKAISPVQVNKVDAAAARRAALTEQRVMKAIQMARMKGGEPSVEDDVASGAETAAAPEEAPGSEPPEPKKGGCVIG